MSTILRDHQCFATQQVLFQSISRLCHLAVCGLILLSFALVGLYHLPNYFRRHHGMTVLMHIGKYAHNTCHKITSGLVLCQN